MSNFKKEITKSLFDKEFLEEYQYDNMFNHIVHLLSEGISEIKIIQMLLSDRKTNIKLFHEKLEKLPPQPITVRLENLPKELQDQITKNHNISISHKIINNG